MATVFNDGVDVSGPVNGVLVTTAGNNGVAVLNAGNNGVAVVNAGNNGVFGMGNNNGVFGNSVNGCGGSFSGGRAPLRLVPSNSQGSPSSGTHSMGELYVDNQGVLYFCIADGTPGMWKKVQLV